MSSVLEIFLVDFDIGGSATQRIAEQEQNPIRKSYGNTEDRIFSELARKSICFWGMVSMTTTKLSLLSSVFFFLCKL